MAREYPATRDARQTVLTALDVLLGSGYPGSVEKVKALRDVQNAAKRMADGIEQHARLKAEREERELLSMRRPSPV